MIKTYALQTLLAIASAVVTMGLLASGHAQPAAADATPACPVTQMLLAGAWLDAPPPTAMPVASVVDA